MDKPAFFVYSLKVSFGKKVSSPTAGQVYRKKVMGCTCTF